MGQRLARRASGTLKRVVLGLCVVFTVSCWGPSYGSQGEQALAGFLGDFSSQRGCSYLMLRIKNPNISCYEGLYMTIVAGRILVDRDTGCILTSTDVPDWADWGTRYRFQVLGSRDAQTWIYEPHSKRTFVVEDGQILQYCPGRVSPESGGKACSCTPIPAVRLKQRSRPRGGPPQEPSPVSSARPSPPPPKATSHAEAAGG